MLTAQHRLVLPLVVALLSQGCAAKSKTTKGTLVVAGIAAIAAGAFIMHEISKGEDTDGDGIDEFPDGELLCVLGGCIIPLSIMAAGSAMAIVGLSAPTADETSPQIPIPPRPQLAAGNEEPVGGAHFQRPLPELPADAATLQFAQQVRTFVLTGRCELARATAENIRPRDPAYHRALVDGPVMRGC